MAKIHYQGQAYDSPLGQSVLHTLLEQGKEIPNSCRAGVCQSCLLQSKETKHEGMAQIGLTPEQIENGFFLSCMCYPKQDLHIFNESAEEEIYSIEVLEKERLPGNILHLKTSKPFEFKPGQFVSLISNQKVERSYSLANLPEENCLEFHIKIVENGAFSSWAATTLQVGNSLLAKKPKGNCTYQREFIDNPLILAGIGTGMAPLLGILRSALSMGHQGPIEIYNGSAKSSNLYAAPFFQTLAQKHPFVKYQAQVLEMDAPVNGTKEGNLDEAVLASKLLGPNTKVYLCGSANTVKRLQKKLFLQGIPLIAIFADPFS